MIHSYRRRYCCDLKNRLPFIVSLSNNQNNINHQLLLLSNTNNDYSQPIDAIVVNDKNDIDNNENNNGDGISIPSAGISISDEIESIQKDRFITNLIPIINGGVNNGVAQLVTKVVDRDSVEPIRYLIPLSPIKDLSSTNNNKYYNDYIMVDIPPYSQRLYYDIKEFMGNHSRLVAAVITSRNAIHYDNAPSVFSMRNSDVELWKDAFPNIKMIGYRLDIPRDCRTSITQILDGYGPFALQEEVVDNEDFRFIETGRPLTYEVWDHNIARDVLAGKIMPPDDDNNKNDEHHEMTTREQNEIGKRLLAIYTPGYTFGSISYIIPEMYICCSGYTIPIENNRENENVLEEMNIGPSLDASGYITTNHASIQKQMISAKELINIYMNKFHIILPSTGEPLILSNNDDNSLQMNKEILFNIINQYEKIGEIYEQLGIISSDET